MFVDFHQAVTLNVLVPKRSSTPLRRDSTTIRLRRRTTLPVVFCSICSCRRRNSEQGSGRVHDRLLQIAQNNVNVGVLVSSRMQGL